MSNTVLIVDDAYFMRNLIKKALKEAGYEVVGEAKDGKEGIKLYFELKPDIVTMDINMPDISGIEATKQILSKDPNAMIIAVTGNNDDDIKQQIIDAGVKEYLQKPFQPAFLLTKLENMMKEPIEDDIPEKTTHENNKEKIVVNSSVVVNADEAPEDDLLEEELVILDAPDHTKSMTIEIENNEDKIVFPQDYVESIENKQEYTLTKDKIQQMEDENLIEIVDTTFHESEEELVIEIKETSHESPPISRPLSRTQVEEQKPTTPPKAVYPSPEIKQPSRQNLETSVKNPETSKEPNFSGAEITKSKIKDKKMQEINIRPTSYVSEGKDEINIRPPRGKVLRGDSDRFEDKEIEEPILNDSDKDNYNDKNNNGIFGIVKKLFKK